MTGSLYSWLKGFWKPPQAEKLDLSRRGFVAAAAAGVGTGLLFNTDPLKSGRHYNPGLIRPPGALPEDEFLSVCVRCGECMKVCVTNVIHPAGAEESGPEGYWTPVLRMEVAYCEHECTLCGQVCPTQAIRELTVEEKKTWKVGQAFFDKNRCLPYAFGRSCIVCEEHCPVANKAIWTEEVAVRQRNGETVTLKQPHVDPVLCTGCGICHDVCPIKDEPGIYVTSAGETRHPKNQLLLDNTSGGEGGLPGTGGSDSGTGSPYGSGGGADSGSPY